MLVICYNSHCAHDAGDDFFLHVAGWNSRPIPQCLADSRRHQFPPHKDCWLVHGHEQFHWFESSIMLHHCISKAESSGQATVNQAKNHPYPT